MARGKYHGPSYSGSGGRIRTCDLWVMSPTSCHCSTPRHGCHVPAMMRGARGGLASPGVTTRVLSGAVPGHDRVRDGSGWSQHALDHGRPASSQCIPHAWGVMRPLRAHHEVRIVRRSPEKSASTIRTRQLQSVARCPPRAYLPGRLPGVSRSSREPGCLVLGGDSRLDAFSGSPCRT